MAPPSLGWSNVLWPLCPQQTTVEEKSRIMQLEEELTLRRAEIQELQARLGSPSLVEATEPGSGLHTEALLLREQLMTAGREHHKESSQLREKYEAALSASKREVERLRATMDKQTQEISDLRQKLQQATQENMEMMDSWKSKLDTLVNEHQRSLEDLKLSLTADGAKAGLDRDLLELRTALESLRMEHQLEVENLKAKHDIEAAVLAKEKEDQRTRLQELQRELEESSESWRSHAEAKALQQALEAKEAGERLQKAELRLCEMEKVCEDFKEQGQAHDLLKEHLTLAEKKMVDYEALQKAEAQSRAELQNLEEKLRVMENRLQAMEEKPQDANVSDEMGSLLCGEPELAVFLWTISASYCE